MNRVYTPPMAGHLVSPDGRLISRAGFLSGELGQDGFTPIESAPIFSRGPVGGAQSAEALDALVQRLNGAPGADGTIQRVDVTGDMSSILLQLGMTLQEFQRGVTSSMTAFPVRENLEAEAKILIPLDTPVRNLLARHPGAGLASKWKQLTSLGGGWGTSTDEGGGGSLVQLFFAETGSPGEHTSVYADKTASYKLMGTFGKVTGFAMAAGANFQNQLATEKRNSILNLMLNEENALINADSTSTAAPWGDGTNALSFDGLVNLIATANGTPSAQVQASVGALTTAHIDGQLRRLYNQGARDMYILANGQEILSLVHLAEGSGTIIRVQASSVDGKTVLGIQVTGIIHPVTGEIVPIFPSRFLPAGTMLFGCKYLPDGSPAADVDVLPQVQLPELAPNESIQGYTAQELAPSLTAAQTYPFIVTVYEVLRMKSALHFAKSSGLTAV